MQDKCSPSNTIQETFHPSIQSCEKPQQFKIYFLNIDKTIHKVYVISLKGLKHQFLKFIEPIYIITICYHVTELYKISTHQMFIHIYLNYGNINYIDIEKNVAMMNPYDTTHPTVVSALYLG